MSNHIHFYIEKESDNLRNLSRPASILTPWRYAPATNDLLIQRTRAPVKSISVNSLSTISGSSAIRAVLSGSGGSGATGAQGATGVVLNGLPGPSGATGPKGQQGTVAGGAGIQGDTGVQGPTGVAGATGAQGPTGSSGSGIGDTGVIGLTGVSLQGPTGVTGATGPQGATGVQGPTGVGTIGMTGPTGVSPSGFTSLTKNLPISRFPPGCSTIYITGATAVVGPVGASYLRATAIGAGVSGDSEAGGNGGGTVIFTAMFNNATPINCFNTDTYGNDSLQCTSVSYGNIDAYAFAGSKNLPGGGYCTSGQALILNGCNGYAAGANDGTTNGGGLLGGFGVTGKDALVGIGGGMGGSSALGLGYGGGAGGNYYRPNGDDGSYGAGGGGAGDGGAGGNGGAGIVILEFI